MKIMKYKIIGIKCCLAILLLFLSSISVNAQVEPMFTQYMFNETFVNPAYTGSHDNLASTILYRNQWVGIEGAPKTQTVSLHAPIRLTKIALGFSFLNESIGVSKKMLLNGNFSYRIMMDKGTLSFGVQGGILNDQENLTQVQTNVSGDNQFSSDVRKYFLPNAGFGIYFYNKKFYAGFSIPRLLENEVNAAHPDQIKNNIGNFTVWHYYFTSGYVFTLNPNVKFKPSFMLKAIANSPLEVDLNANFIFNDLLWVGGGYRTGDAISGMVGLQLTNKIRIGYSYDYTLSNLQQFNSGTHEFVLNYDVSLDKLKYLSPRYF